MRVQVKVYMEAAHVKGRELSALRKNPGSGRKDEIRGMEKRHARYAL